jgi:hypothetical protein
MVGTGLEDQPVVAALGGIPRHYRSPDMKINEGKLDRGLRFALGAALVGMAATGVVGLWGYVGVVPLLTAAIGFCPLYAVLGISTCPVRR